MGDPSDSLPEALIRYRLNRDQISLARPSRRTRLILGNGKGIGCIRLRIIIAIDTGSQAVLHTILDPACDPCQWLDTGLLSCSVPCLALANLTGRGLCEAPRFIGLQRRLLLLLLLLKDRLLVVLSLVSRGRHRC